MTIASKRPVDTRVDDARPRGPARDPASVVPYGHAQVGARILNFSLDLGRAGVVVGVENRLAGDSVYVVAQRLIQTSLGPVYDHAQLDRRGEARIGGHAARSCT